MALNGLIFAEVPLRNCSLTHLAPMLCIRWSCVVLDMACHVPLYRALLELLRAIAVCPPLMPLLLPLDADDDSSVSISSLLEKMKQCVDTYASRLKYVLLTGWQFTSRITKKATKRTNSFKGP